MPQPSFEHRLIFFGRKVNANAIAPEVNQLVLDLLQEAERKILCPISKRHMHALASMFTRPSTR